MFKFFNHKIKPHKLGNTLSETLIALTIVGVVFTIAMGTIVADINRNQTVERLKKVYASLADTFNKSSTLNGSPKYWYISDGLNSENSYEFFNSYLKNFLVLLRDCKTSTQDDCNYVFKELDGTEKSLNNSWVRFYLNDGTFMALQTNGNDKYKVIYFYADINGKKRLNVVARDIFIFEYWIENSEHPEYEGRLLPFGHEYSRDQLISASNKNNCNVKTNGNYCAALIMNDNWQIINDYPWAHARYVVK